MNNAHVISPARRLEWRCYRFESSRHAIMNGDALFGYNGRPVASVILCYRLLRALRIRRRMPRLPREYDASDHTIGHKSRRIGEPVMVIDDIVAWPLLNIILRYIWLALRCYRWRHNVIRNIAGVLSHTHVVTTTLTWRGRMNGEIMARYHTPARKYRQTSSVTS